MDSHLELINKNEPLLTEDDNRFVMFPIQDQNIWDMYKKQVECFWRAEEVDLSKDMVCWNTLNQRILKSYSHISILI